jgi:hypothetical protein
MQEKHPGRQTINIPSSLSYTYTSPGMFKINDFYFLLKFYFVSVFTNVYKFFELSKLAEWN